MTNFEFAHHAFIPDSIFLREVTDARVNDTEITEWKTLASLFYLLVRFLRGFI